MTAIGISQTLDGRRTYSDPLDPNNLLDSVTTIINACSAKPWLTSWAARLAAEAAVDQRATWLRVIDEMGPAAAVDLLKGEAERRRDAARERGTWVHDVAEALVLGGHVPSYSPDVEPYVTAFIQWFCDFDPTVEMCEATVANRTLGYAGTLDLVATLPGIGRKIIDIKTGAHLDQGMNEQLSAYGHCEEVWLPHGQIAPMPAHDGGMVLHIQPDAYARVGGYKLYEAEDWDASWAQFARYVACYQRRQIVTSKPGRVVYPPLPDGSQPPPLIEDIDGWTRTRSVLVASGYTRLSDLAAATCSQLLAIKGFGSKSLEAVTEMLAAHGLALREEVA